MAFKVKCMVEGPGVYTLEYGKGSKKIVGKLELGADKQWYLDAAGEAPYSKKREALAAWSAIAVANYGGTPAPPPRKAPSLAPPPRLTEQLAVPQLDGFFKEGSPQQIQDCINKGPTRADQIRRWYQAWQTTGNEFMLPAFVPMTPMKGPPRISPKDTNDTDSNPPEEAAPADPNQAIDVEAADVSGEQGADAPV